MCLPPGSLVATGRCPRSPTRCDDSVAFSRFDRGSPCLSGQGEIDDSQARSTLASLRVDLVMRARGRHPYRRLTDLVARRARPGRHADGNGLYLFVRPNGSRSWIQRIVIGGRRRDLGLGPYPLVSLADARRVAEENRRVARSGGDPVASSSRGSVPSVREMFEEVVAARRVSWRNPATERKWRRLFDTLVSPKIGSKPIDQVTVEELSRIVLPNWHGRGSTGYVLRQHLDTVMRWAMVNGHRRDNPAAQVKELAPKVRATVRHHPSLPHRQVCDAMRRVEELSADPAVQLALLFTVLCAARIGEVVGATWSEIDIESRVWTRPAERMKAQLQHRVPLPVQALEILDRVRALNLASPLIFAVRNRRGGARPVAPADLARLLHPLGFRDEEGRPIVMHGFRSTFRVWAMEVKEASYEACESALAHVHTSQTVSSYARSDLLEVRRELMQEWANYVVPRPQS